MANIIFLLLLVTFISAIQSRNENEISTWYVSLGHKNDEDVNLQGESSCGGSLVFPCSSLYHVMKQAKGNDVILVDGAPTTQNSDSIYELCDKHASILNTMNTYNSLTIIGYNGLPRIGCSLKASHSSVEEELQNENVTEDTAISNSTLDSPPCNLLLKNIELQNGVILFANCTIKIVDTIFNNASIMSMDPCHFTHITLSNLSVYGRVYCIDNGVCVNNFQNNITCSNIDLNVDKSQFYQTMLIVDGSESTNVNCTNSIFSNKANQLQFMGGLHLTFSALDANIYVAHSTFEKQVHPNRVQSVINLYEAAIWLKAVMISPKNETTHARATVENCTFEENERGITIVGPYAMLKIFTSDFITNIAMHAGAAMLILLNKESTVLISNSTFQDNVAGKFRHDYPLTDDQNSFQQHGSEVHLNATCCKGVIDLVGKGGAVRIQRGKATIVHSKFINNTARLLGGSVFVDIDGKVHVHQTYFENTPIHDHALQGDILYSDGILFIKEVTFKVRTALNGLSIFRHSGDHWTLDITNVWIQCPVGYDLRTTNSSAYGVTNHGLRRSYKLDQLSYFCDSCPRNKYSLDHGYLNYTMVFNAFAYFTLLINGSEPKPQYTGKYIHHKIQCEDCPYGGHCVQGITSVANFWGYKYNDAVKFQHCPKGYCCSTTECPSINSCTSHRQGTLCGRCTEGYSEALFSPACIPNEKCGQIWIYPFSTAVGLVYAIFLLFQADLQQFLFSKPIGFNKIVKKFHKQPKLTYMNGLVKNENQDGPDVKFIPNGGEIFKSNGSSGKTHQTNESENRQSKRDNKGFGSGFLVIMFYYFQDALLLNVETVYVTAESKGQKLMKSILSGIFKFQLDLFELLEEVCVTPNMTVVPKILAKALIVPYVIALFLIMFILYTLLSALKGGNSHSSSANNLRQSNNDDAIQNNNSNRKSFTTRLASGFVLAVLFMFQKLGTTTFTLLNCVPVEDEMVLFKDGTITCYQPWQYAVMAYATFCVTPFFIVLLAGPSLLQKGEISLLQFFLSSLFPLPFLFIWTAKFLYKVCRPKRHNNTPKRSLRLSSSVKAVVQILQGPFKQNACGLCWSGVLIGRRLVLILLFTFVADTLIRLLCMLLACFVILLHHVHIKPYKDKRGNLAGTVSASALVVLGSINLVRAAFEAAEYTPAGPNSYLMKVFDEIENVLLLWGPLCIMSMIVLVFLFRVMSVICNFFCGTRTQTPVLSSSLEESNHTT